MIGSVYERRRFIRVSVNLDTQLNLQVRTAMKQLSLGGCLVDSVLPLAPGENVRVRFSVFGEQMGMDGRVVHAVSTTRFGIRFEPETTQNFLSLASIIERIQESSAARRPTRVPIRLDAVLDRQPSSVVNLSEQGCFLQTHGAFNPGDIVEVRFRLGEEAIHLAAQIRWKTKTGIGVEYLSPDPGQIQLISNFITREIPKTSNA